MNKKGIYTEVGLGDLADQILPHLKGGENIYLSGELGAGKTTFSQIMLSKLGYPDQVISPTFQLIAEYQLPSGQKVAHVDLYRLTTPDDLAVIGVEEYLEDPKTIVLLEWPERGEGILPRPKYHLHFTHRTPTTRIVEKQ